MIQNQKIRNLITIFVYLCHTIPLNKSTPYLICCLKPTQTLIYRLDSNKLSQFISVPQLQNIIYKQNLQIKLKLLSNSQRSAEYHIVIQKGRSVEYDVQGQYENCNFLIPTIHTFILGLQ